MVFLGALRDSENEMKPSRNSKLAQLLRNLVQGEDVRAELVQILSDANNNLITAIDYYNNGDDELGNEYASKANDLMNQAVDLKNSRDNLVNNNPDYFNLI